MGLTFCILVSMVFAASMGAASRGFKEHGKHGKQPKEVNGHHNVHFDHEAILGSHKLEEEFDELPEEEAKERLRLLVIKMDQDHDGFVSKAELTNWIIMSFRSLDEEEAMEEFEEKDEPEGEGEPDGKLSWEEYVKGEFSYTLQEVEDLRKGIKEDINGSLKNIDEDEKKFKAADQNGDGFLTKEQFAAFYHPEAYPHMHHFELENTMAEHDKDKDGFLSFQEYLGEGPHDKETEIEENKRFAEYDVNKDNVLSYEEIKPWILDDTKDEVEEAVYLIKQADENEDGKLSSDEILESHEDFVGSQATSHGLQLHFIKRSEEL